jgi:hypothetical protein
MSDLNRKPIPPVFAWHDRARGMYFEWDGSSTTHVAVYDHPGGQVLSRMPLLGAEVRAVSNAATAADALAVFGTVCRSYTTVASPVVNRSAWAKLSAALDKAEAAGDDLGMDHLNAVLEAAQDLRAATRG